MFFDIVNKFKGSFYLFVVKYKSPPPKKKSGFIFSALFKHRGHQILHRL